MLLAGSSILGGCFDTPSSPASPVSPTDTKTPLKQEKTLSSTFAMPEGVTEIRSAFSEANTPDWGNAQNWTSDFYKDGESIGYDLSHQFVPCRSTKSSIPTQITIHTGTCFVNESVEISRLEMAKNSRMTIPEGVMVTNTGELLTSDVTIDGGGDFSILVGGSFARRCNASGNVNLNTLYAPEVRWANRGESFEVNNAELYSLAASKIHVKDRLKVSDIGLHDRIDLAVNQLHITKSDKEFCRLTFKEVSHPLNIDRLSFDPGTEIEFLKAGEPRQLETANWKPIRLMGILDVTNMNPTLATRFNHQGIIGEKVQVFIADKGIVGDPNFLRMQRRRVVTGYDPETEEEKRKQRLHWSTIHLVWVEGNSVYWQRIAGLFGTSRKNFLLCNDLNFMKLASEYPNKPYSELLGISATTLQQVWKICEALRSQRQAVYENATEAGIERYLAVQTTPDAKERVLKLLELADIKPYLNERDELSESGVQSVVDSLSYLGNSLTRERYGLQVMNRPNNTLSSRTYGLAFGGTNYSVSGAFHQNNGTAPWVMGAEYRTKLQADVWGILRTIGEGVEGHPFTLRANCGMGYALSPASQLAVFVGSQRLLGSPLTGRDQGIALPLSAVWSMGTGVEFSTRVGAHELRVGGEVSYRPEQSTSVRITDLAVTLDNIAVVSGWNVTGSVGYAYKHEDGIQWFGNMSVKIGDNKSIFGTVGVTLER